MKGGYDYHALHTEWAHLRQRLGRDPTIQELWHAAKAVAGRRGFVAALRRSTRAMFLSWDQDTDLLHPGPELEDEVFPEAAPAEPAFPGAPGARKILFLAANPAGTDRLLLKEEAEEIQETLRHSPHRDQLTLEPRWGATPADLLEGTLNLQPEIIHFSGHGLAAGRTAPAIGGEHGRDFLVGPGSIYERDEAGAVVVTPESLAALFERCRGHLRCVVLNACHSEPQAEAIAQHIDYVVGMRDRITDRAARWFSVGFYRALCAGNSYKSAFAFGTIAIQLHDLEEHQTPVLKVRTGSNRSGSPPPT